MTTKSKLFRLSAAAAAALTLGAAPPASDAAAGPFSVQGETTVTGPGGNTATRAYRREWDPATQTYTRGHRVTGPNGASRTVGRQTERLGPGEFRDTQIVEQPNGARIRRERWIQLQP